jgi:hypothetical protein
MTDIDKLQSAARGARRLVMACVAIGVREFRCRTFDTEGDL